MLYWVIVKRPSSDEHDDNALLRSMISRAQPIPASTLDEIRAACLVSSDHRLFRRHIAPLTVPDAEKLLLNLSADTIPDEVEVDERGGGDEEFVVDIVIDEFRRRMGVMSHVSVEFIAKGACALKLLLQDQRN
jgi:hypothetical protein